MDNLSFEQELTFFHKIIISHGQVTMLLLQHYQGNNTISIFSLKPDVPKGFLNSCTAYTCD